MTTTIRLGALTLTGAPCCPNDCGFVRIIFDGDAEESIGGNLRSSTLASLVRTAAVVEAAREWREAWQTNGVGGNVVRYAKALNALADAIDALDATRDGGK